MTERLETKGGLWSDFDGTAVRHYSWKNPRNWAKYPLPMMPGYDEFLRGSIEGGLTPEAVVSRRPDIMPRRVATARSLVKLKLQGFFPEVILTGSEAEKTAVVARRASDPERPPIAMLEDKPHNFVPLLADALEEEGRNPARDFDLHKSRVVVGAVNVSKAPEYLERTAHQLEDRALAVAWNASTITETDTIMAFSDRFSLVVVGLPPFSHEAGQQFAEIV